MDLDKWYSLHGKCQTIEHTLESTLKKYDLQCNEFCLLYRLSQEERHELNINQLQEKIGLSQSAMSRLVQRMEIKACGCIERVKPDDDKRSVYIRLTPKGEALLKDSKAGIDKALKDFK